MAKTKIIFLFNQLTTRDLCTGGEIRGHTIAKLAQKDFNVKVVLPNYPNKPFNQFSKIFIGNKTIEKAINNQSLFSIFILYCFRTIEAALKIPKIKTDVIYATGDFFCNTIPCFFFKKRHPNSKFIVSIHHIISNPFTRKNNSFAANVISYLSQKISFKIIKSKADLIFVVNQQVKNDLLYRGFKQPICITGNGLDIKKIQSDVNKFHIKPQNNISYFGRMSPTKGIFDFPLILSAILNRYPDIHLDLIGNISPEIKTKLINSFNKLGCQNHYTLHGFISKKTNIYKILLASKVIIFPSYEEGWGISLFESIMTKRPIVAYNLPIFQELFKNKLFTAPIGKPKKIAQKAITLIDQYNCSSTKKYIRDCYQIAQKYDWEKVYLLEKQYLLGLSKKVN